MIIKSQRTTLLLTHTRAPAGTLCCWSVVLGAAAQPKGTRVWTWSVLPCEGCSVYCYGYNSNKPTPLFLLQMYDNPQAPEKPAQPQRHEFYCKQTGRTVSYRGPASAIFNRKVAQKWYSARRMFALNKRRSAAKGSVSSSQSSSMTREEAGQTLAAAMREYDAADDATHARWTQIAREHDARQPGILAAILSILERDPTRGFDHVAADIGGWCCGDTIRRFFESLSYSSVLERVLPLVKGKQRKDAVDFARRFRNNWGRGKGKYLLVHLDEKWFYGLLLRHAKVCEALGLEKTHLYAQHKNHITKVLMLAVVGIAFEDSLENGGIGVRLGIYRAEAAKIAGKRQNEARVDPESGKVSYPKEENGGTKIRDKGDVYFKDVEVTGSTSGTSSKPKFCLLWFLREILFPQLQTLVGPGGQFEGYCPIIQWDNAGPHTDKTLVAFAEKFCAEQRPTPWGWEPQGPQMPHANVLDLLVFPKLSRHHGHVVRRAAGRSVAKPDVIWQHARAEFLKCSSVDIAKAFVLAHRLMAKVIAADGYNHFLDEGGVHSGVREDFTVTVDGPYAGYGITRKDGRRVEAPAPL